MRQSAILKRVLKYAKEYKIYVVFSFVFAVISTVLSLYIPIVIGQAIDHIISIGNVDMDDVVSKLIVIGICAVASAVAAYLMKLCNNRICFGVVRDMRRDVLGVIEKLPLSFIDSHKHGDLVSRVIADADSVSDGLLLGSTSLFSGIITILITLVFMFITSVPIAITVVVVTPLSLVVARFIARKSYKLFLAQSKDRGEQTGLIDEVFSNLKCVQAFGRENACMEAFDETAEKLKKDSLGAVFFSSLTNPSTRFVNNIVYAAVGVFGALFAVRGSITVGVLTAFLSYANQYTKPFNEISAVITELQNAIACAGRIMEIIDEPCEEKSSNDTVLTDVSGSVCFDNVYFSYDKQKEFKPENALIKDLNLSVKPGSRVAIVGPTGAGKSTIINLLMRFYDVDRGAITVSDFDIAGVDRDSLREHFGMVLQETWLMHGTVRENIAFGRPDATYEEVEAAAKEAHAHSFIMRLPDGYDTVIDDASGLSAGQRQLLCIARVMLDLPPMLILDEATSSIDTRTEMRIRRAFDKMMQGRTSFIVAHRLQTIREADVILVMRDGAIVEQGSHEALIAANGFYKQLYDASRA